MVGPLLLPVLMIFLLPILFVMSPLFDALVLGGLGVFAIFNLLATPLGPEMRVDRSTVKSWTKDITSDAVPRLLEQAAQSFAISLPLKTISGFSVSRLKPDGRTEVMLGRTSAAGLNLDQFVAQARSDQSYPILMIDLDQLPESVRASGRIESPGPVIVHGTKVPSSLTVKSSAFVVVCNALATAVPFVVEAPLVVVPDADHHALVSKTAPVRIVDFPDLVDFAGESMVGVLKGELSVQDLKARSDERFAVRPACDEALSTTAGLRKTLGRLFKTL